MVHFDSTGDNDWGRVVSGIMLHHRLGDPTPATPRDNAGEDPETAAMRELFASCLEVAEARSKNTGEDFLKKSDIREIIRSGSADAEHLHYFGFVDAYPTQSAYVRLGKALKKFDGRVLSGVRMPSKRTKTTNKTTSISSL